MTPPLRGEVWLADLDPTLGHEQGGRRPVLVISEDAFNRGPANLVVVVPLSSVSRGIRSHVPVAPPEGGLRVPSVVLCEAVQSVSTQRLVRRWGAVSEDVLRQVESLLRVLLRL